MIEQLTALCVEYAPRVAGALLTLVIGFWLAGWVSRLIRKALSLRSMELALQTFLGDLAGVLIKAVVVISAAGLLGIQTTSFVAILGAAGLAVGLALQGSLANFAGGVLILLFKPFRVGDLIEAQGHFGHVRAINIFVTTLESPESKTLILPNGPLSNGNIANYSSIGHLRVDLVVGISYASDIARAKAVILEAMRNNPQVLQTPAPSVHVLKLDNSSVNLAVRPYATPADYWDVYFGVTEQAKLALDQAGIQIPFPQVVVHQA